jgi:LuxR family maltose regulon positive regulatory protein
MRMTNGPDHSGTGRVASCDKGESGESLVAAAKTRVPPRGANELVRERLLALLDEPVTHLHGEQPVTLVCAPAGSGKTTMLASWARRRAERTDACVAWVSLDREDNNAFLLWSAILRALRVGGAWPPGVPRARLRAQPGRARAPFMAAVITALESLTKPVILVLDDVHEVDSPAAVRSLNHLLRHLPATLRIVLVSRFPPPLILPRLRLEGRLREVSTGSLTFERGEAAQLLTSEGIELTGAELDLLMERTEGWAAGLRLAAMNLADAVEPAALLARFTGDDRVMADYLAGEVLARLHKPARQLLLTTSICPAITVDLAVVLPAQHNAGQLLDDLERANVLISPNGQMPRSYRCHPLLRGYLRAELNRRRPSFVRHLHRTAADWFVRSGDLHRAITHAIAAKDDKLVSRLVSTFGLRLLLEGKASMLRSVLDAAPAQVLAQPVVALVAAAAALDHGDLPGADRCLLRLRGEPVRAPRLRTLNAVVSLYRARLYGDDLRPALAALHDTRTGDTSDTDLDLFAALNRGTAAAWLGHQHAGKTYLRRALHLATAQQYDAAALHCRTHLAGVSAAEGDLVGMGAQAQEALDLAQAHGWDDHARCGYLYALLGADAHLRLDSEGAQRFSVLASKLSLAAADPTIELLTLILQAVVTFDKASDPHAVLAAIRRHWRRLHRKPVAPALIAYTSPTEQRMALQVGEHTWAVDVFERAQSLLPPCGEHALLHAMLQAHKGRLSSARRLLAPVINAEVPAMVPLTTIDAWLLEARLADRSADDQRAHEALLQALALAEQQRAVRPFLEAGPTLRSMLARQVGRFGRLERFADTVLGALPSPSSGPHDALTDREQALLTELPSMRTTEEIADTMFVSVNTVKTHLRGIYRKLGVNQRRDAITTARRHGLL